MHAFTHFHIPNGHVCSLTQLIITLQSFFKLSGDVGNSFGVESRHLESHAGSRCAHLAPVEVRNAPSPLPRWII